MEALVKKRENFEKKRAGTESLTDSSAESRESNSSRSSSETSSGEVKRKGPKSPALLGWPIRKAELCKGSAAMADSGEPEHKDADDSKYKDLATKIAGQIWFSPICA